MFNMWTIFEKVITAQSTAVKKSIYVSMLWTNMWWILFGFSINIQHREFYLLYQ